MWRWPEQYCQVRESGDNPYVHLYCLIWNGLAATNICCLSVLHRISFHCMMSESEFLCHEIADDLHIIVKSRKIETIHVSICITSYEMNWLSQICVVCLSIHSLMMSESEFLWHVIADNLHFIFKYDIHYWFLWPTRDFLLLFFFFFTFL